MSDLRNQVFHIINQIENPRLVSPDDPTLLIDKDDNYVLVDDDYYRITDEEFKNPIYPDTMSAFDYLSDALDIEYIIASDRKTFLGARVLVAYGGPNIWVNTRTNRIECYWWNESFSEGYYDNIGLNEALEELWNN